MLVEMEDEPEVPACIDGKEHEYSFVSREFDEYEYDVRYEIFTDTFRCEHCGILRLEGADWLQKSRVQHWKKVVWVRYVFPAAEQVA